jgi:hypothetical protein
MAKNTMHRRDLLKGAMIGLATIPVLGIPTRAGAAAVDVNDAQAKALGFVLDAKTVDAKANPNFKPGQTCANCAQYKGAASDASAPCAIFAGKTVPGAGWCKVWATKPG